jgi:hypothetical protein
LGWKVVENKDAFRIFATPASSNPWRSEVIPELQQYSPQFIEDLLTAFEERAKHHPEIVNVWRGYLIYMARRRYNIEKEIHAGI